jgi:2'-5' RNA ligase
MRLFYAIGFDETVIEALAETQRLLREQAIRGNFTLRENLHLTLAFMGELDKSRVGALLRAREQAALIPFELIIRGVGRFARDGGDIVWAG